MAMLIIFEGGDAAGKTTCAKGVMEKLKDKYDLSYSKGIGSETIIGRLARKHPSTFLFCLELIFITLFRINPGLKRGKIIIQDRYNFTIESYLPSAQKIINRLLIKFLNSFILEPDIIVYFNVDIGKRIERLKATQDNKYHKILIDNPKLISLREEKYQELLIPYRNKLIAVDTSNETEQTTINKLADIIDNFIKHNNKIDSVGIGITNKCNLNCPHCYSRALPNLDLKPRDFLSIIQSYPNLKQINFGTGESILNQDFLEIISICRKYGIKMALTTNGLTVEKLADKHLALFKDVDFSLDFPSVWLHDQWRGTPGLFQKCLQGVERCQKLKINTSIACCLMNINYKYLPGFRKVLDKYGIFLRLNIYKPAQTKEFSLNYEEFWEAMRLLAENFELVSSSEPILSIVTKDNKKGSPCGECSVRIHPDKSVSPCVYLQGKNINLEKFQNLKQKIPEFCKKCNFLNSCQGGCLSRRILNGSADRPDAYCPFFNKKKFPDIQFKRAQSKEFIHSDYLCTIIAK